MPEKKREPGICPIFHAALLIAGPTSQRAGGAYEESRRALQGMRKAGDEDPSGKCLGKECEAWSKFNATCGLKFTK